MFVFPLGLGTKLRRAPVVTLGVALLWTAVLAFDRSGEAIAERFYEASAKRGLRDTSRDLFVQYCVARQGSRATCERYSHLVLTGYPAKSKKKAPSEAVQLKEMTEDAKIAARARKELKNCKGSRRCFVYKDIVFQFLDKRETSPRSLAAFDGFSAYAQSVGAYRRDIAVVCRTFDCLVPANVNVKSVVMAQLRHGNFGHLFANLVAFVIFGIYVEQRTRRALYLGVLALGGTVGMLVHTRYFGSSETLVVGGSANVSAVMGLFYVFFFHKKMRFQVFIPQFWAPRNMLRGAPFYADVKYCFPLLFFLSDLSGGLDSGFSNLLSDHVAHFAHLGGFGVGIVCGLLITWIWRLPPAIAYEDEVKDLVALEASRDMGEVLGRAGQILRYNPENVHAMEVGCAAYLRWSTTLKAGAVPPGQATVFERGRVFLADNLQSVCAINARRGELRYACKVLALIPLYMPFRMYLRRLGQVSALKLGDFALANGDPVLALRLYDFFLARYGLAVTAPNVEATASNIIGALTPSQENRDLLSTFLVYHPDSLLASRIGAWLSNAAHAASEPGGKLA